MAGADGWVEEAPAAPPYVGVFDCGAGCALSVVRGSEGVCIVAPGEERSGWWLVVGFADGARGGR